MCAETDTVARALSFITACRLDANCELESAEAEEEEGNVNSREHFGLKVGLALSFIAMTLVASCIPVALMKLPYYNVRSLTILIWHVTALVLPCDHCVHNGHVQCGDAQSSIQQVSATCT